MGYGEVWWVCGWGQVLSIYLEQLHIILYPSSLPFPPPPSPHPLLLSCFLLLSSAHFPLLPLLFPSSYPPFSPLLSPRSSLFPSPLQEPEIIVHVTSSTATTDHTDNTTSSSSSSSSSSSAAPAGSHYLSSQLLSEKTKLVHKI